MSIISVFRRAAKRHELLCEEGASPCAICILVHGTFAPNARWTRDGSSIRTRIEEAYSSLGTVRFCRFIWRGRLISFLNNTHSDRLAAGSFLAESIRRMASEVPDTPIFLVGHSHGGNVILYALGELENRTPVCGMASIATPFFTWRANSDLIKICLILFRIFLLAVAYAILLSIAFESLHFLDALDGTILPNICSFSCFCLTIVLFAFLEKVTSVRRRIESVIESCESQYRKIGVPAIVDIPKFVSYVDSSGLEIDEAYLWLALGEWVARLPVRLGEQVLIFMAWIPFSPLLLILLLPLFVGLMFSESPIRVLAVGFITYFIFPAFIRSLSLFYGGESVIMNAVGKVDLGHLPPAMAQNHNDVEKSYKSKKFFAHGLYENFELIRDLSEWMVHLHCSRNTRNCFEWPPG